MVSSTACNRTAIDSVVCANNYNTTCAIMHHKVNKMRVKYAHL